jgi:cytochrome c-type biogenesis protein CcsB
MESMESIALLGRTLFLTALVGYALSTLAYLAYILFPKNVPRALPTIILTIVSILNIGIVILRSVESGRSPFSSRYESIIFFGMFIGVVYLLTEWRLRIKFGGLFASLIAVSLFFYIIVVDLNRNGVPITFPNIFYLIKTGGTQLKSMPLMPALQSPWFFWHVSLAFLGYAFFACGFIFEITSACISIGGKPEFNRFLRNVAIAFGVGIILLIIGMLSKLALFTAISIIVMSISGLIIIGMLLGRRHTAILPYSNGDLERLRRFTYTQVLFAFPLMTWCIVSGGAWADKAWGTYWGWDPKEIWSLITWLIYVCYFHIRLQPNWRGRAASIVHVIAFLSVITTYLMVNYLVNWFDLFSMHAYTA